MPPAADLEAADEATEHQLDAAPEHRKQRLQRTVTALRALLAGGVFALLAAVALYFIWNSGIKGVGHIALGRSWNRFWLIVPLWLVAMVCWMDPSDYRTTDNTHDFLTRAFTVLKFLPVAGVAAWIVYTCLPVLDLWQETAATYGVRLGERLAFMMGITAFGLIAMAHICLNAFRSSFVSGEAPLDDEATVEDSDSKPTHPTDATSHRHRPRPKTPSFLSPLTTALALLPTIALVSGFAIPYLTLKSTHASTPTITQTTSSELKASQLPTYPTSFGSQKAWVKDVEDLVDIVSGAAGPVLLTNDSITGINPSDGSTRWQYRRAGSQFQIWSDSKDTVASGYQGLITSPNGRYVAAIADDPVVYTSLTSQPKPLEGESPRTTIVIDAVTGKAVLEHPQDVNDHDDTLQLSDSALLDGAVAYSLSDGSQMWDLRKLRVKSSGTSDRTHIGTAGHSSFILQSIDESDAITVISQSDPSHPKKVAGVLHERKPRRIITAQGWIGIYDDHAERNVKDDPPTARRAHAVSLDALAEAPNADTRTFDMGSTLGINAAASLPTGTLSVLPDSSPVGRIDSDEDYEDIFTQKGFNAVSTIFDPATMTVTSFGQAPHYVAAVGVTTVNPEGGNPWATTTHRPEATTGDGQITIRTGDGSIIPVCDLEPGSIYQPPLSYNSSLEPLAGEHTYPPTISALSTPGATIAILDDSPEFTFRSHAFRLYGIPG